jgi:hypothetical protein
MDAPQRAGFARLLLAVFCPPLYFFRRGRVVAGVLHSVNYLLAIATLIFGVGIFFWAAGMIHAWWDFAHIKRDEAIHRHATVFAEKLAEQQARQRDGVA